jgi:ankyrin repeat protein
MLAGHPALADESFYVAALIGDVARMRRQLDADPALATRRGGPRGWDALLYLCYGRVSGGPGCDPLAVARLLLERGADPNSYVLLPRQDYRFTALTGAMGWGEAGPRAQPPHSQARELAILLLDAGADPNDSQGLYNTMFDESDAWLQLLLERGLGPAHRANWRADSQVGMLDYLLGWAVSNGRSARAALLLEHGADPNGRDFYNRRPFLENALLNGYPDVADLLRRHAAVAAELTPGELFQAACLRGDSAEARRLLAEHPECGDDPLPLMIAAERGHLAGVRLLLELGFPVDARDPRWPGSTPLHRAALKGHLPVVRELLARGAPLTVREQTYGGTPIGAATQASINGYEHELTGGVAVKEFLLERTSDVFDLTRHGRTERLAGILAREPGLAQARVLSGYTPLHFLKDDTPKLDAVIELLLAHGADLEARNEAGQTPLEFALHTDQEQAAEALRRRAVA